MLLFQGIDFGVLVGNDLVLRVKRLLAVAEVVARTVLVLTARLASWPPLMAGLRCCPRAAEEGVAGDCSVALSRDSVWARLAGVEVLEDI